MFFLFKYMRGISPEYFRKIINSYVTPRLLRSSKKIYWLAQKYYLKRMVKELSGLLLYPYGIRLGMKLEELTRLFCLRKNWNLNFSRKYSRSRKCRLFLIFSLICEVLKRNWRFFILNIFLSLCYNIYSLKQKFFNFLKRL